MLEVQSLAF